jgi:hypothetical protein
MFKSSSKALNARGGLSNPPLSTGFDNPAGATRDLLKAFLLLTLLVVLAGCGPAWQATVVRPDGSPFPVDKSVLKSLDDFAIEIDGQPQVPLERVLLAAGHRAVDRLEIVDADGARHEFEWAAVADDDPTWLKNGHVVIGGEALRAASLQVEAPALMDQVQADLTDVAPTVAAALGLPAPSQATGRALTTPPARHALLIFLDGFGYVRYAEALDDGLIPYLGSLDAPLVALTAYVPCTAVASASLLTGAAPEVHGATQRSVRKTEVETLFDVASAAGLRVVAVEGDALSFNLRNADLTLSGDRDGNGGTDDNVLSNALAVLQEGMPDLLFVHFHGIDDQGHEHGPGAAAERLKIGEVDAAVEQIVQATPPDTLVIIFADHGMHAVDEEGRQGNHGHLVERDMFVPIFIVKK